MGGGKSSGSSTTKTTTEPWKGQQPYLQDMFSSAASLYNSGGLAPDYYPGQTLAGMDSATQNALNLQEARALAGNDGMRAAQQQLTDTMNGKYMGANPELDALVGRAIGQTNSGVNSNFASAGRYGSGAQAAAANDAAGNIASQMYGDAYKSERDNQIKSMMFAPQLAEADYQDLAALSEVGTARENYAQGVIDDLMSRYNYTANQPMSGLQNYANLIQGNYGMSGSSTASGGAKSNPLGGVLGGSAGGAGLAGLLGATAGGPAMWGAAGLGGLLGLL